jgi:ABC-type transport system involved in multi-copper enzyme maturation permease subunit
VTTPSQFRIFALLSREALSDATRRRIVPLIAVMALLSLLFVDSCTSCSPQIQVQGQEVPVSGVSGMLGLVVMVVLGLWTQVLAGILASDHLAEPLADGSAALVLSRPVSRGAFALSRLAGAVLLSLVTGALLLFATALLLQARQGLPVAPALAASVGCALGVLTVGSLAMAASLYLPRVATALAVLGTVWGVGLVNAFGRGGVELGGWVAAVDRFGPPLATVMVVALRPWIEPLEVTADPMEVVVRAALWAAGSTALVVLAFRRFELT